MTELDNLVIDWNNYLKNVDESAERKTILERGWQEFELIGENIPVGFEGFNKYITEFYNGLINIGIFPKRLEYRFIEPNKNNFRFYV